MSSRSFDAVFIGGRHHATIVAAYLAKPGMRAGIFERMRGGGPRERPYG
jgi:phytoene dehydrogenase-like protein